MGEMKRQKQEEKKSVCSECEWEQSNNRDPVHDAGPALGKIFGKSNSGKEQESGGQLGGGVPLPSSSSEPTRQEVGTTTPTTTEVSETMYEPTEPGFGVTEPGVHGPRPQSYAAPWPGSLSPGTLERLARNHRQERFQWGVALPKGRLRALPAHRLSNSRSSSNLMPVPSSSSKDSNSSNSITSSSKSSSSNSNSSKSNSNSSSSRTVVRKARRRRGRKPRRGRGVLRVGRRRVPKPPGLE